MKQRIRPPTIVIVDDDPDCTSILSFLFTQEMEFSTRIYRTGLDILKDLQLVMDLQPALFFIDQCLPRIEGLSLCEVLRTQAGMRRTPLILITADRARPLQSRAERLNVFILGKPFDLDEIVQLVRDTVPC